MDSIVVTTLAVRQHTHGDFSVVARVIQGMKEIAYSSPNYSDMPATHREAVDMIIHKLGRVLCGNANHADHWHDIQGYAKLVEDRLEK